MDQVCYFNRCSKEVWHNTSAFQGPSKLQTNESFISQGHGYLLPKHLLVPPLLSSFLSLMDIRSDSVCHKPPNIGNKQRRDDGDSTKRDGHKPDVLKTVRVGPSGSPHYGV